MDYSHHPRRHRRHRRRSRRRRSKPRHIALNREEMISSLTALSETDVVPQSEDKAMSISVDDPWECAPSIAWVLMYFVLIAMVCVCIRFYPEPLFTTQKSKSKSN